MLKQEAFINACLGLCLLYSVSLARAAVEESVETEFPDLELLEFLGQFATDDGNWLEPNSLLSDEFGQLLDAATENDTETDNYIEAHSEEDDL
jgi:hypothetical protein